MSKEEEMLEKKRAVVESKCCCKIKMGDGSDSEYIEVSKKVEITIDYDSPSTLRSKIDNLDRFVLQSLRQQSDAAKSAFDANNDELDGV